ncbi:CAP domain-containing protein [Costertonia aggregata]|uniref:CAP domain-containing protein n=1 Tax=Costertonia aggregata TaxID=343403 RepID=A0A7H9AQK8_9FLAO|nr:CAP domain-containing protein [Costertonia aggregata]QLG45525.1 CAP domain-containing protein [Costertonia aggregata]
MKVRMHYAAFVLFVCTLASCSSEPIDGDTTNITKAENAVEVETELLEIVNNHRASLNRPALLFSEVAYEYANAHNDYMISKGSLSHDNFSSRASKISSKANAEMVAENVAKDYDTAAGAFQGWLKSVHHKNTMEGKFTHTAVSVKKDANGNYYFTQLFYR